MEVRRESEVVAAFVAWLRSEGWTVKTEVDFADVVAERGGERLVAEAKGVTSEPGLDVDTMYGQLLRRMDPATQSTYAIVGADPVLLTPSIWDPWVLGRSV